MQRLMLNSGMRCRLYLDQPLQNGQSITLAEHQAHYLRHVMRMNPGDAFVLFNGRGGEYECRIEQFCNHAAQCRIEAFTDVDREMACRVHIIQAACRNDRIEHVLQKGTELGAASFRIVASERSPLRLDGHRLQKRLRRWEKIIIEAAEQSGRTRIPPLAWTGDIDALPIRPGADSLALLLHPDADADFSTQARQLKRVPDIALAIGPEGGWSPRDMEALEQKGFSAIAFGPRILRTETAAPALLAAIQAIRQLPDSL